MAWNRTSVSYVIRSSEFLGGVRNIGKMTAGPSCYLSLNRYEEGALESGSVFVGDMARACQQLGMGWASGSAQDD